jgi:hypothetical protein
MGLQRASSDLIEVLAHPDYVGLACDIYNASSDDGAREQCQADGCLAFLSQPENRRVVAAVRKAFPDAVKLLGNRRLLEMTYQQCKIKLRSARHWQVSLHPDPEWPSIWISPRSASDHYWCFHLEMNAKKVPYKLYHGVAYIVENDTFEGGQPLAMSQRLKAAAEKVKAEFERKDFHVKPGKDGWFAKIRLPDWSNVDYIPERLKRIANGGLAPEIAGEFVDLFKNRKSKWAERIEGLNSLLR